MNHKEIASWEQVASEFLSDRRMMDCRCSNEALELVMELGNRITGEKPYLYFLTHRDEHVALSKLENKSDYDCTDCTWLKGLILLADWHLGYDGLARVLFQYERFEPPVPGQWDFRNINYRYDLKSINHYHIGQLKGEQRKALLNADLAKLRLFVDLAPEPKKKMKQLLLLAFKEKKPLVYQELLNWLPDYPDALDSQFLFHLLLNVYLPKETEKTLGTKLSNLEQYPLMKTLVDATQFREHWFMYLMSAGLMSQTLLKTMLEKGFSADIPLNVGMGCSDSSDLSFHFSKNKAPRNSDSPSLRDVMHLFRSLKRIIIAPLLDKFQEQDAQHVDLDVIFQYVKDPRNAYRNGDLKNLKLKMVLLYCILADAFTEWESEKSK